MYIYCFVFFLIYNIGRFKVYIRMYLFLVNWEMGRGDVKYRAFV